MALMSPAQDSRIVPVTTSPWSPGVEAIDTQLKRGEWEQGQKAAAKLLASMEEKLAGGGQAGTVLAAPLMLRGIARIALGEAEEGLWDLQAAWNLDPRFAATELSAYGEPLRSTRIACARARFAEKAQIALPPGESACPLGTAEESPRGSADAGIKKPEKLSGENPQFLLGSYLRCLRGRVIVQLLLDRNGKLHSPFVVRPSKEEPADPMLVYRTLKALRTWKFRPAQLAGSPIEVSHLIAINYEVDSRQRCPAPRSPASTGVPGSRPGSSGSPASPS